MFDMLNRWYKRRFSDPHAVSLVMILLGGFLTIYFFGHLIAPLLVAIVLAYLLEWPVMRLKPFGYAKNHCRGCGARSVCWPYGNGNLRFGSNYLASNQ